MELETIFAKIKLNNMYSVISLSIKNAVKLMIFENIEL